MIALVLCVLSMLAPAGEAADAEVVRILLTPDGEASEDDVVRALSGLGPDAIPTLLRCASGGAQRVIPLESLSGARPLAVPAARVALAAEAALAAMAPDAVREGVVKHVALDGSLEGRAAAARVLGASPTAEGVPVALAILRASTASELGEPRLGEPLLAALAAPLARHAGALDAFAPGLAALGEAQLAFAVLALAAGERGDGAGLLVDLASTSPAPSREIFDALGRIARRRPFEVTVDLEPALLRGLGSPAATVRAAAARATGEADASGVAWRLIELLADGAPEVRAAARAALRRMSGCDHDYDLGAWGIAVERERRWRQSEGLERLLARIGGQDALDVRSAVGELQGHRLSRALLGERIGAELPRYRPSTAAAAAAALAALDARTAIPGLVDLLHAGGEPVVRRAAHEALKTLTGLELEPAVWRTWLVRR